MSYLERLEIFWELEGDIDDVQGRWGEPTVSSMRVHRREERSVRGSKRRVSAGAEGHGVQMGSNLRGWLLRI